MRDAPKSKKATLWRGASRWYAKPSDAYYSLARAMVAAKYPRWLQHHDLDDSAGSLAVDESEMDTVGDMMASLDCLPNWRSRRVKAERLFMTEDRGDYGEPSGLYFDPQRWRWFVRRVARFMAFVDSRRSV